MTARLTFLSYVTLGPFQWQRGLRRGSEIARLLGLEVRIPPETRMSVSYEYCVVPEVSTPG